MSAPPSPSPLPLVHLFPSTRSRPVTPRDPPSSPTPTTPARAHRPTRPSPCPPRLGTSCSRRRSRPAERGTRAARVAELSWFFGAIASGENQLSAISWLLFCAGRAGAFLRIWGSAVAESRAKLAGIAGRTDLLLFFSCGARVGSGFSREEWRFGHAISFRGFLLLSVE